MIVIFSFVSMPAVLAAMM